MTRNLLWPNGGKPLHVVASCDGTNRRVFIITAYEPSLDIFESDYRTKKVMTDNNSDICPLCDGTKTDGTTTFSADLGSGVVVVRQVRATVCSQCGEEWIDDATARQLEEMVNDARERKLQVEVAAFK